MEIRECTGLFSGTACFFFIYLAKYVFLSLSNVRPDFWFTIQIKFKNSAFCDHIPLFN